MADDFLRWKTITSASQTDGRSHSVSPRKESVMQFRTLLMAAVGLLMVSAGTIGAAAAAEPDPNAPAELDSSQVADYKGAQDAAGLGPGVPAGYNADDMAAQGQLNRAELASAKLRQLDTMSLAALPAEKILSATHSSQSHTYWCGPSAVAMALRAGGLTSPTQTVLAGELKTTTNGTDWYGKNITAHPATGRPVKDVLNGRFSNYLYLATDLSYSPTAAEKSTYKTYMMSTITQNHGLVGGAWEVNGGPKLNGHPGDRTIYHYITMLGYTQSGAQTRYGDPASGSSTSWAGSVPQKSDISSATLTTVLGGRGYVW